MRFLLTLLLFICQQNSFTQDSGFSVFANLLGNGSVYSIGLDYEAQFDFPVRPGIQIGAGFNNAYTKDSSYSIPLRFNLHFAEKGLHHWIVGGGVSYTDGINNLDDNFTEENVRVGYGSFGYHKDIAPLSGGYFRSGLDFTGFQSGDVLFAIPIPNLTLGYEF